MRYFAVLCDKCGARVSDENALYIQIGTYRFDLCDACTNDLKSQLCGAPKEMLPGDPRFDPSYGKNDDSRF